MNDIIKKIEDEQLKAQAPEFRVGDTVKVYGKIKEGNRERIQVFEGVVLKRQGGGNRETFTVRKASNGVGVEKTWPLHSPNVEKVEVVRRGKVRRAKLNYLRQACRKSCESKRACKIMVTVHDSRKHLCFRREGRSHLYSEFMMGLCNYIMTLTEAGGTTAVPPAL